MMNDKKERLGRLRTWVQEADERREHEAALPKALCRTCGGWVKAGEGHRDAAPETGLRPHPTRPGMMVAPSTVNAPKDADDWRRECGPCARATLADTIGAAVGFVVEENDAHKVVGRMKVFDPELRLQIEFPTAQTVGNATGKPWGHLSREDRDRVRYVLQEVIADRLPGISRWGACGLCGRRHSIRWFEGPAFLRWPDGAKAPVCSECQAVVDRRPVADSVEALRVIAVEAATGYAQMFYTAPVEFRCYAEVKDCDGNGHAEPWTYSPGVIDFREEMWIDFPHLAPSDRRAEFEERLRMRIADDRQKEHVRQEREAAQAW